jgi:peptidoglycan-associated lipoprotein
VEFRGFKMKKRLFFFILLILIFEGCVKKSEIPLGREIFENQSIIPSNLTAVNKTKEISGKHKETIGIPEKLPEVVEKQEEHEEKIKKADKYTYWSLFGRSSKPFYSIFFDFDDFSIRKDMWGRIKNNAKYLLSHPEIKIQLQGNCDERGSNEYNLALGEKRAMEVKKVLVKLGVKKDRISVISFGEERPLAKCHNEVCWAINRRVDFVIIKNQ